jgi:hypothetical protein
MRITRMGADSKKIYITYSYYDGKVNKFGTRISILGYKIPLPDHHSGELGSVQKIADSDFRHQRRELWQNDRFRELLASDVVRRHR